jgi:hypothetical protein
MKAGLPRAKRNVVTRDFFPLVALAVACAGCDSILGIADHPLVTAVPEAGSDASSEGSVGSDADGDASDGASGGNPPRDAADADAGADGNAPVDAAADGSLRADAALDGRAPADAAADASGSPDVAAAAGCTAGATQCSSVNPNVPQTCNASAEWVDGRACQYVCAGGSCVGVCIPGSTTCSNVTPQTCDGTGQWVNGAVTAGTCGAVCTPNDKQCQVNDLATCQSDGTWPTTPSMPCPYGCLNKACRDSTYGTIGVAGTVTCETSPGLLTCATNVASTTACCWDTSARTGTCYSTTCQVYNGSTSDYFVSCDGPNDCAAGQVCCYGGVKPPIPQYNLTIGCTDAASCTGSGPQVVCDPAAPTCAAGMTCAALPYSTTGTQLYTCQ